MKENNVSMFGGCLPALLPMPILFALYAVFQHIDYNKAADLSFLGIQNVFVRSASLISVQSVLLAILAALSTYIPSLLLSKATPQQEGGINMGSMSLMMAGMMGFMAFQFPPILIIYWIFGGLIQLVQTYFLNYIPAKKREMLKQEQQYTNQVEKAKKSTPKTKKR
jgi:YidC/Oxa1 family membrane protein insertase